LYYYTITEFGYNRGWSVIDIRDFTQNQLITLYTIILRAGYNIIPFYRYLTDKPLDQKIVILRHDVDRNKNNAFEIAKIENDLGICSSYYFRYPYTFDPGLMAKISVLGHEIGYHYEVLAKAGGDQEKAIQIFQDELKVFRKVCEVKTICAHGSPLSRYDNRDLWKEDRFTRFGIRGDAQLSINTPVTFFTDTGRSWDINNNLRDTVVKATIPAGIRTTADLISYITPINPPALYLVIHPERWTAGGLSWYVQYSRDLAFNYGKTIIRRFR
jgi:hypothetical protein